MTNAASPNISAAVTYTRATTLDEALALLACLPHATVLAGGTDIYPHRTARRAGGHVDAARIVDISGLTNLRGIEDRGDHWWLGALTTWSDIVGASLPPVFDALKAAARDIGGVQIQNRGTIAGNCCTASPAGDSIPCLMSLDASIEIAGRAARQVSPADFFTGYRATALMPGELVTGIRVPKQSGRSVFRKLGARRYLVISIAMVAAVIDRDPEGIVTSARFAIGACSASAQRLPMLEAALMGKRIDPRLVTVDCFAHLHPIDDIRATAAYRRHAAIALTRAALSDLAFSSAADTADV